MGDALHVIGASYSIDLKLRVAAANLDKGYIPQFDSGCVQPDHLARRRADRREHIVLGGSVPEEGAQRSRNLRDFAREPVGRSRRRFGKAEGRHLNVRAYIVKKAHIVERLQ